MSQAAPKVSVIIPSYQPGEGLNRVVESLDGQTLPQSEFETIVVDDGSPDDTFARLEHIAASRPNMRVMRIENSGWPSRPRNVGMDHARGEYLMFMDHDDSLYPDGLRRAYEYAAANNADVLSPKESKTNDVWWGMPSLNDGNIPNAIVNGGIDRLVPMIPHKLYRRQMFLEHGIRFPEGPRMLWEDIYINVAAYRHAKVVSVLADTPVYLWHASDTNSSHSFEPSRVDFWDRLEDMMEFASVTLDGPDYREARARTLALQVRVRVIDRCVRLLTLGDVRDSAMALRRAQRLLSRFNSDEIFALLPKEHQAQSYLMRSGDADLMVAFYRANHALKAQMSVAAPKWDSGGLRLELESRWAPERHGDPGFRRVGDRVLRDVSPALARAVPPELLDVTDDVEAAVAELSIRGRAEYLTWAMPLELEPPAFETNADGVLGLVQRGRSYVDLERSAFGNPLQDTVWDLRVHNEWIGMERKSALHYDGPPLPALLDGRAGVAYSNASHGLTVDFAQRLRTFAMDAMPTGAAGEVSEFSAPLTNVDVFGETVLDAGMVVAIPESELVGRSDKDEGHAAFLEGLAEAGTLHGRVVGDATGARFKGGGRLAPGTYILYARREGALRRTHRTLVVDEAGLAEFS